MYSYGILFYREIYEFGLTKNRFRVMIVYVCILDVISMIVSDYMKGL